VKFGAKQTLVGAFWFLVCIFTSAKRYCDPSCLLVGSLARLFIDVFVVVRGVATGGGYIGYTYTLPKSVQINFLWGNNDLRTVIEHEY